MCKNPGPGPRGVYGVEHLLEKILQYLSRLLRWSNVGLIKLRYSGDSRPDDLHRFGSKTTKEILFPSTIKAS
jgi:hypothetical protein